MWITIRKMGKYIKLVVLGGLAIILFIGFDSKQTSAQQIPMATPPVLNGVQLNGKDLTINYSQLVEPDNGTYDVHFQIGEPDGQGGCDAPTLVLLGSVQLNLSVSQQDISFIMPLPIPVQEDGYCIVAHNYVFQEIRSDDSNKLFLYPSKQADASSEGQVLGASTTNTPQVLAAGTLAETGQSNIVMQQLAGLLLVTGAICTTLFIQTNRNSS